MDPERNLRDQSLVLPAIEPPAYDYEPLSVHAGTAYLAGQLAKESGTVRTLGRVPLEVSEDEAGRQMELCALQALAQLKHYLGSLERVQKVVHMQAYVACAHDYPGISTLADRASRVFITAFADAGRHPRSVIGVMRLPQNAPVMIDLRVAV